MGEVRCMKQITRGVIALVVVAGGAGALWSCAARSGERAGESQGVLEEPMATEKAPANKVAANVPAPGETKRVGGDVNATVTGSDGDYHAGSCFIDTPLPKGYPMPTPPGAMEIKSYPSVRRAVVKGSETPDSGMNDAFWPLFNHIKKHDIAMTSPVEMDFEGMKAEKGAQPTDWSMAFLYRTPELNATGQEKNVQVVDAEPVTVVSIGMRGNYSMKLVRQGMEQIEAWLTANPEWKAAGSWRTLYYNGPAIRFWNKWAEVQLPVKRAVPALGTP